MTRPNQSALVLDGSDVKLRLLAERVATKSVVHVDWVRFTVQRRNSPAPSSDILFPTKEAANIWDADFRAAKFRKLLAELPGGEFDAHGQALDLANEVAEALGPDFSVAAEVRKGHDFYKFRWSIELGGSEVGWVGFLSSSDSPRQQAQSKTLHANIYGSACTFACENWRERIADIVEDRKGDLTRCDLALDFFEGFAGGILRVVEDYQQGRCDVGGKQLKCNQLGDWLSKRPGARSFYMGSKEAGKQTNVYEKGDQLFGIEAGSTWLRIELRYGNKLRVLSPDMLRRPADFFAGASDWHAGMLAEAGAMVQAQSVPTAVRLPIETVKAEVSRAFRWLERVAAPIVALAFEHGGEAFLPAITGCKLPGRLKSFSKSQIAAAFASLGERSTSAVGASPVYA